MSRWVAESHVRQRHHKVVNVQRIVPRDSESNQSAEVVDAEWAAIGAHAPAHRLLAQSFPGRALPQSMTDGGIQAVDWCVISRTTTFGYERGGKRETLMTAFSLNLSSRLAVPQRLLLVAVALHGGQGDRLAVIQSSITCLTPTAGFGGPSDI